MGGKKTKNMIGDILTGGAGSQYEDIRKGDWNKAGQDILSYGSTLPGLSSSGGEFTKSVLGGQSNADTFSSITGIPVLSEPEENENATWMQKFIYKMPAGQAAENYMLDVAPGGGTIRNKEKRQMVNDKAAQIGFRYILGRLLGYGLSEMGDLFSGASATSAGGGESTMGGSETFIGDSGAWDYGADYGSGMAGGLTDTVAEAGGTAVAPASFNWGDNLYPAGDYNYTGSQPSVNAEAGGASPGEGSSKTGAPGTEGTKPGGGSWIKPAGAGAMSVLNLINAYNKANMQKDLSAAQQQSYQKYLNAINADAATKASQYEVAKGSVSAEMDRARKMLTNTMAARGIRGKGTAGKTGDLALAEKKLLNDAYNKIYGTYNVPSAPGPTNYAPSGSQTALSDATQYLNYLYPLLDKGFSYFSAG